MLTKDILKRILHRQTILTDSRNCGQNMGVISEWNRTLIPAQNSKPNEDEMFLIEILIKENGDKM